jgi:N-methylhydantoinase A
MRVGIEVGGTFADLGAIDGGRIEVVKVPSTLASPNIGALRAERDEPGNIIMRRA